MKKIFFPVLTFFLVVLFLEGACFVLTHAGIPQISFSQIREVQEELRDYYRTPRLSSEVVHPYLGYVYNYDAQTPEEPVSRFGFHDDKDPIFKRAPGRVIIGISGGSFAEYFAWEGDKKLIQTLKSDPGFAEKEIIIVRLGLGGYKTPQGLMTLAYLLTLGAEFDFFININGFNGLALSIAENLPKKVFPVYPRGWFYRSQTLPDPQFQINMAKSAYLSELRAAFIEAMLRSPLRYSYTANLVWKIVDKFIKKVISRYERAMIQIRSKDEMSYLTTGPVLKNLDNDTIYTILARTWQRSSGVRPESWTPKCERIG